jgi:hypothetical protein
MPHWMLKAAFQGVLSLLPKSHLWNYLAQKYAAAIFMPTCPETIELTPTLFEYKLRQCKCHIESYLAANYGHGFSGNSAQTIPCLYSYPNLYMIPSQGLTGHPPISQDNSLPECSVLELGTGLYPVIPMGLYLCGASKIWTIDKVSLLRRTSVATVLRLFMEYATSGRLFELLPCARKDRIANLAVVLEKKRALHPMEVLKHFNIYSINCDARDTKLEDSSIEFFISNNTLEHISSDVIQDIFTEFRRLSSYSCVMSHYIDMIDHYRYFDQSLSFFNFRKYSSNVFKIFNNSLLYQNRNLYSDYISLHQNCGFKIIYSFVERVSAEHIEKIALAKEFLHYSLDELLLACCWIVSTCKH